MMKKLFFVVMSMIAGGFVQAAQQNAVMQEQLPQYLSDEQASILQEGINTYISNNQQYIAHLKTAYQFDAAPLASYICEAAFKLCLNKFQKWPTQGKFYFALLAELARGKLLEMRKEFDQERLFRFDYAVKDVMFQVINCIRKFYDINYSYRGDPEGLKKELFKTYQGYMVYTNDSKPASAPEKKKAAERIVIKTPKGKETELIERYVHQAVANALGIDIDHFKLYLQEKSFKNIYNLLYQLGLAVKNEGKQELNIPLIIKIFQKNKGLIEDIRKNILKELWGNLELSLIMQLQLVKLHFYLWVLSNSDKNYNNDRQGLIKYIIDHFKKLSQPAQQIVPPKQEPAHACVAVVSVAPVVKPQSAAPASAQQIAPAQPQAKVVPAPVAPVQASVLVIAPGLSNGPSAFSRPASASAVVPVSRPLQPQRSVVQETALQPHQDSPQKPATHQTSSAQQASGEQPSGKFNLLEKKKNYMIPAIIGAAVVIGIGLCSYKYLDPITKKNIWSTLYGYKLAALKQWKRLQAFVMSNIFKRKQVVMKKPVAAQGWLW